jgi:hypothetical protein
MFRDHTTTQSKFMKWKIWYLDKTTVEGTTEEEWNLAPVDGVVVIGIRYGADKHGRTLSAMYHSSDWYWMENGNIFQNNESDWTPGVWVKNPAPAGVIAKMGRWTTDEHMTQCELELVEWTK